MYKFRLALLVALIVAMLLPLSVQAAGVFYCSTLRANAGTGTYADPWACSTNEQLNYVIYDVICARGGGWLYQIENGSYVYYRVEWVGKECQITFQQRYQGYPPNTGVNLPMPFVVGGVLGAGALMIVGGLALRRKRH